MAAAAIGVMVILALAASPAAASAWGLRHSHRRSTAGKRHAHRRSQARQSAPRYRAALLEDADTGKVLFESNADLKWPPASMAKMMLLLVANDQIKAGRFTLDEPVRVSERAAHTGGSRLGLRAGEVFALGELMKAALIKSANDAAVAVAEKIAGSVEACVRLMNQRARQLELERTEYKTVDGLPPRPTHDADITDAYDLARLGREIIHQTNLLEWSGLQQEPFDGGTAVLRNTNHLVGHFEGCDGLKTGFTSQAGFNLTATAKRGDMRLVAVVLGAPSNSERFRQAARLLEWGFENFARVAVLRHGQPLPVRVQVESGPLIQPLAANEVSLLVPKNDLSAITLEYHVPPRVSQPVLTGDRLGEVVVRDGQQVLSRVGAICPVSVGEAHRTAGGPPAERDGLPGDWAATSTAQGNFEEMR